MSRITLGACLVVGWMLLWGDVGLGPLVGGTLVVVTLFVVFPSRRPLRPHVVVHPAALARLVGVFVVRLVVSNVRLTRELLRRRSSVRSAIVEVPMRVTSPSLLTAVVNLTALSPGTVVVDAHEDGPVPVLVVHVLMLGDDDGSAAVASLHELEALVVAAFGTDDARAEVAGEVVGW